MLAVPSVSAAQTNTALLSYLAGDIDGDWTVSTADARALLHAIVTRTTFPAVADANGDGVVNTSDASHVLKASLGNVDTALIKPTVTYTETAPEGDEIAFERTEEYFEYSGHTDDVWIAQSLEELQASYLYSDGKEEADYSTIFNEEFFEDKAVIVYQCHIIQNGLVDVNVTRLVRNDNQLCLVRNVELFLTMPFHFTERFLLVVSKEDLVGVDTISLYTEYTYRE